MNILYPIEDEQVHRHSSIDQFGEFISVWKQGGWAPLVFDQLDGITCDKVKTHPVIISWGDDLGYIFPEAQCTFASDKFIYFDKNGVEQKLLPECMGGKGEFYDYYVNKSTFLNFNPNDSLGVHNTKRTRVGLSYVKADKTLTPVD